MTPRRYSRAPDGARSDASEIAREVILSGQSEGWSGELAELDAVAAILDPFQIVYVDDMRGRWAARAVPARITEPGGPARATRPASYGVAVLFAANVERGVKRFAERAPTPADLRAVVAEALGEIFEAPSATLLELVGQHVRLNLEQRRVEVDVDALAEGWTFTLD